MTNPDELSMKAMSVALDATYKALEREEEIHEDDCPCKSCWQKRISQADRTRKELKENPNV